MDYSVRFLLGGNPNQICEELMEQYGENYAGSHVFAVKVSDYDGTSVQFESEAACPSYQRHFFIIPAAYGCILIEAQFDFEMYEGLYPIMQALFDTLKIG